MDRPALIEDEEIEVTAEMIKVGKAEYARWNDYYDNPDTRIAETFRAMFREMYEGRTSHHRSAD